MYTIGFLGESVIDEALADDTVPDKIKRVLIADEELDDNIRKISSKYHLDEEQASILSREIVYILLNIKEENNFFRDLLEAMNLKIDFRKKENLARELWEEVKPIYDYADVKFTEKQLRHEPWLSKAGDSVVYSIRIGQKAAFAITTDSFKEMLEEEYRLEYIRNVIYGDMSALESNGCMTTISLLFFSIVFALISFACVSSGYPILVIVGLLGFLLSFFHAEDGICKTKAYGIGAIPSSFEFRRL